MATSVYIQILTGLDETRTGTGAGIALKNEGLIVTTLLDDATVEYKTEFSSYSELLPQISDLLNLGTTIMASTGGSVSGGWLGITNLFDMPRWKKTEPVRIQLKLGFYTKTEAYEDVWRPTKQIINQTILTRDGNQYNVPGLSLTTMKDFSTSNAFSSGQKQQFSKKSKLISLEIPGIIYLPIAIVESAVPTYSKNNSLYGYPIWATLDMTAISCFPATSEFLDAVESSKAPYSTQEQMIVDPLSVFPVPTSRF